ncbi:glycoside hydrolase superfamily [Chytriomyces sp. MP71]|nr:glycoside hydrolase superfamily [Chytriomyces sp. MP71]
MKLAVIVGLIGAAPTLVVALSKLEPQDGKILFGPWYDSSTGPVSGGDTAGDFNNRIGFKSSVFQMYQHLPPVPPTSGPPDYGSTSHNPDGTIDINILNDNTNASLFLTVYPDLDIATDTDITALASQMQEIRTTLGREIFIRLGPEMNGNWFDYSKSPSAFVVFWIRFYKILNSVAPEVALVWAPNEDVASQKFPYAPYWPGEQYVDWVCMSMYWKGLQAGYPQSYLTNSIAPLDYTAQLMDAAGPEGSPVSFYQEYAVKYDKPMCLSEGGTGFNLNTVNTATGQQIPISAGPGRAAVAMSFWNSNMFSPGFLIKYPKFKLFLAFEIWKEENEAGTVVDRDYRISSDPDTLAAFKEGLKKLDAAGSIVWAEEIKKSTGTSTATSTSSKASPSISSVINTAVVVNRVVNATSVSTGAVAVATKANGSSATTLSLFCMCAIFLFL